MKALPWEGLRVCALGALLGCGDGARPFTATDGGGALDVGPADGGVLPPTGDVTALDAPATDLAGRRDCTNVDLLFVIDNSGSMADQQASLVRSFPGFIDGIRSRLRSATSIHLGVVTTSDTFENAPGCTELGSLIVRPAGPSSSNRDCRPFRSGANYLDQTQPDLAGRFACVGTVGTGGSDDERPMRALLNALRPESGAPGRCNAGFLRRDSLLVIVLITDEDDVRDGCDETGRCMMYGSGGTSEEWHREVLAARGGIAQNVVVLSLLVNRPMSPCGGSPASRLIGFTRRFGANGYLGDVCAMEYAGFFTESLRVLENACANFVVPP